MTGNEDEVSKLLDEAMGAKVRPSDPAPKTSVKITRVPSIAVLYVVAVCIFLRWCDWLIGYFVVCWNAKRELVLAICEEATLRDYSPYSRLSTPIQLPRYIVCINTVLSTSSPQEL